MPAAAFLRRAALSAMLLSVGVPALGEEPASSPFDKNDPEIVALRKLDWKNVNFDAMDARSKCTASFFLSRGLVDLGAKTSARLELLIDFLDEQKLGETFATDKGILESEFKPPSYEDLRKVAAAYLHSPTGSAKLADEFSTTDEALLNRYVVLYEKSARRDYEDVLETRMQVRSMALFLEKRGKLNEFKEWAAAERKKRAEERKQELADQRAVADKAEAERRDAAKAAAEARRQQQEETASQQLQYSMQETQPWGGGGAFDTDNWWGDYGTTYWGGYASVNAYRGAVRDRSNDAMNRWRTGRPSQLPARTRGGGRRR